MEISEEPSIILDSSVWIAYLHEEDSQHKKAVETVDALSNPVIVPTDVLGEVATTLKKKRREDLAKSFVREVVSGTSIPLLVLDESTIRRVGETFVSHDKDRLSFTDTILFVLSEQYHVITFDRALARAITNM